jgi:hypothetical protein
LLHVSMKMTPYIWTLDVLVVVYVLLWFGIQLRLKRRHGQLNEIIYGPTSVIHRAWAQLAHLMLFRRCLSTEDRLLASMIITLRLLFVTYLFLYFGPHFGVLDIRG